MDFDNEPIEDVYYTVNGRIELDLSNVDKNAIVVKHFRLRGGKGGFGSMLRAIGSQIEKTTNHEMCRDLTGRRMRDVNMEKALRVWYTKASEREKEKLDKYLEKRRKRQEILEKGPIPGHKFENREYDRQKLKITDDLQDSIASIIETVKATSASSNKASTSSSGPSASKRNRLWIEQLDVLEGGDSTDSSSDSGSEIFFKPELSAEQTVNEVIQNDGTSAASKDDLNIADRNLHLDSESQPASLTKSLTEAAKTEHNTALLVEGVTSDGDQITTPTEMETKDPVPAQEQEEEEEEMAPLTDEELQDCFESAEHLAAAVPLNCLKTSLQQRGLKCSGTALERAARLFAIRNLAPADYPAKLRAKPTQTRGITTRDGAGGSREAN